jgi:5-methylcytosine-specific restriction endonuclease McrA
MAMDRSRYPANWDEISRSIRIRARWRCENCGVKNHAVGYRDGRGRFHRVKSDQQHAVRSSGLKLIKIVLTVSHQDHDTTNNDPSNLKALCQRCHLRHDAGYHAKNAALTRRRKRLAAGQQELPL